MQAPSIGLPMSGATTLSRMRPEKERTPFGDRLYRARTHAKLTQAKLAQAAGISQGTLGELEWIGEGSSVVVRLAMACHVRAEWLAEGEGEMLDTFTWPFDRVDKDLVLALSERDLGHLEGVLSNELERLLAPTPDEVQRLGPRKNVVQQRRKRGA